MLNMEPNNILASLEETKTLISKVKSENFDSNLWIQAFSQLDGISDSLMDRNNENILMENWVLDTLASIVNEIEGCLHGVKQNGDIESSMYNIIIHMMNILWRSFKYCQLVGSMCADKQEVNENLASFFKLSYQNVKVIMEMLETHNQQLFYDSADCLIDMIVCIIKCSEVLADIDIMASVAVWKSIKRLFTVNKDLILANHSGFAPLFDVCGITCHTLNACFGSLEKRDGNMIGKYQKVIRFFLGIVLLLTKEFKNVMTSKMCSRVYDLIHLIQRLSLIETRTLYESKGCLAEYESLYNTLLCVNDPLMKDLVEVKCSAQCVLENSRRKKTDDNHEDLVYLLDVINVMEYLTEKPEYITSWMESSSLRIDDVFEGETSHCSILDVLFSSVDCCSASMFIQRKDYTVIDKSKCLKEASLYEIVLGKLCAFVSTLPSKYFEQVELVMLSNILLDSKYSVLLATDLWCFISRWGKADLCMNHYTFLGKLLVNLNQAGSRITSISNVSQLLRRLFWFLEDNQHQQILLNFPILPENIALWKILPLSYLNVPNKLKICSDVVETCVSLIEMKEKKENNDHLIVCAIECLGCILCDGDLYSKISSNTKQHINKHIYEFWSCFQNLADDIEIDESLVNSMLSLTSKFLPYLEEKGLVDILSTVNDILHNTDSQTFQVQCTYFLMHLKDVTFPVEIESNCLNITAKMFQFLLSHQDWFVDSCSMKALQMFAEETVYSRALVNFLPRSRKKDFSSYLRKEAYTFETQYEKVLHVVQNLSHKICEEKMNIPDNKNSQILSIIDRIDKDVSDLDDFIKSNSVPTEYIPRVQGIISILEKLCR